MKNSCSFSLEREREVFSLESVVLSSELPCQVTWVCYFSATLCARDIGGHRAGAGEAAGKRRARVSKRHSARHGGCTALSRHRPHFKTGGRCPERPGAFDQPSNNARTVQYMSWRSKRSRRGQPLQAPLHSRKKQQQWRRCLWQCWRWW